MADELSPYRINVDATEARIIEEGALNEEKKLEAGAYGYVYKVVVGGVERIAKKLHKHFTNRSEVSAREVDSVEAKFRVECVTLSKLRHPNIVQFIGVHYGRQGKSDLTLIMECVSTDLYHFLERKNNVPLSIKLSILRDVSFGLVYLHEHNPPIIHRDLTARNILITSECQAKIADLGMAKIVNLQAQLANSHTSVPGQMYYMPPEALQERASCTPKLDIFSFGHLSLCTALQNFPIVYNVNITPDVMRQQGRIERLKRRKSIDTIGEDHCLHPVITDCLFDSPDKRPNTRNLNERIISLSALNPISLKDMSQVIDEEREDLYELKEKLEEREGTIAAMDLRYKDVHSKWIRVKEKLSGAFADTSRLRDIALSKTEQVKQFKKQSDTYRDQLQQEKVQSQSLIKEEKENMQQQIQEERVKLQRKVAMFQEDIRRKEEEHRAEVSALNLLAITITPKPGNISKGASSDFRNQAGNRKTNELLSCCVSVSCWGTGWPGSMKKG